MVLCLERSKLKKEDSRPMQVLCNPQVGDSRSNQVADQCKVPIESASEPFKLDFQEGKLERKNQEGVRCKYHMASAAFGLLDRVVMDRVSEV